MVAFFISSFSSVSSDRKAAPVNSFQLEVNGQKAYIGEVKTITKSRHEREQALKAKSKSVCISYRNQHYIKLF